jgi:hypothetical protein
MVGQNAVVTNEDRDPRRRSVVAGLGVAALLAIATAALVALLGGTATAQTGTDPGPPLPYGGQLEQVNTADQVSSEQVLEVGMLALGTLNGVAFVIAMVASRLRGPSTAQTRRALIARTGAGVVSESRRERRERERDRTGGAAPAPAPVPAPAPAPAVPAPAARAEAPAVDRPAGGPSSQAPRTPPPGAVPVQGGPAPREGLVPAGRAPVASPSPSGNPSGVRLVPMSPPTGTPSPVQPPTRR